MNKQIKLHNLILLMIGLLIDMSFLLLRHIFSIVAWHLNITTSQTQKMQNHMFVEKYILTISDVFFPNDYFFTASIN